MKQASGPHGSAKPDEAPPGPQRVMQARRGLAAALREAGIVDAGLSARFLAEEAFRRAGDAAGAEALLAAYGARRAAGEPVWRILGEREFWGLTFGLSAATLEPRPDSETLVEAALALYARRGGAPCSILDLGTGTGCLLVALLSEFPAARGVGVDLAPLACETAAANAARNGVAARAAWLAGSWTAPVAGALFDLVVSNPPYIASPAIAGLDEAVRRYDPALALDGGADGLDAYRALAREVPAHIAPGGALILEIGAGQEEDVAGLIVAAGLSFYGGRKDLGGHVRALIFEKG